jgi:hypothetical protein
MTPGEWKVVNEVDVQAGPDGCLAYVSVAGARGRTLAEAKANAQAIARLPDLLEVVKGLLECPDTNLNELHPLTIEAINKARELLIALSPQKGLPELGRNDETTVYCGLCAWLSPITSFEEAEHKLSEHLRKVHGRRLRYSVETETGRIKPTPDSEQQGET